MLTFSTLSHYDNKSSLVKRNHRRSKRSLWTIAKQKNGFLLAIFDKPPKPDNVIPNLHLNSIPHSPPPVTKPTYGPPPLPPFTYKPSPFSYVSRQNHHIPFYNAPFYHPSIYHHYPTYLPPPTTTTPSPLIGAPAFNSSIQILNNSSFQLSRLSSPNITFDDAPKLVFGVSFRIRRVYGCEESDKLNCDTLEAEGSVVDCDTPRFR